MSIKENTEYIFKTGSIIDQDGNIAIERKQELVRCKDCKYGRIPNQHDAYERMGAIGTVVCCAGFDHVYPSSDDGLIFFDEDHFCADGERSES